MGKIYIFGIGGTGSRVIRALSMLLASGVEIHADAIVPIIVDPDASAADLTRTVEQLRNYCNVRKNLEFTDEVRNRFFKTDIKELLPNFRMNITNTQNQKFKDYIGLSYLDESNEALVRMLFSEANLESDMEVGFKGNPNIGSVVLNSFTRSQEFVQFADSFDQGDKIFIISSIFGGTGASGFPVLLKRLRTLPSSINNSDLIRNAPIGAVTVLPYFGVSTDLNSQIDQSTFISKTKAALSYYEKNMTELDCIYYAADQILEQYENKEGGIDQKNKAHVVELISALSILDFAENVDDHDVNKPMESKEFGIKTLNSPTQDLILSNFEDNTYDIMARPLTQFTLFAKYINERLKISISSKQNWAVPFTENKFFGSRFMRDLVAVKDGFMLWLEEMSCNHRAFTPFELKSSSHAVFNFVKGAEVKKVFSTKSNYDLYDDYMNKKSSLQRGRDLELRFMEISYEATSELINAKIKL